MKQQTEFRNVWSATEPRQESLSDEGHGVQQSSNNGPPGSAAASGRGGVPLPSVGQSDLVSNPPQHEEMDDIFPLDACRRLEVL